MKFYFVFSFMLNFTQSVFSDSIIFYGDCFFFSDAALFYLFFFCFSAQPTILRECLEGLQPAYMMWMYVRCACSNIAHMVFMWWFFPHHRCLFVAIAVALLMPPKRTNERTTECKEQAKSIRLVRSFISYRYQLIWK